MSAKWKTTDPSGFAALIKSIKNALKASDAAASDVSGLQGDIQNLASQTTQGFQQANTALQTLDGKKLDKTSNVPFVIPANGWNTDESADEYPIFYELAVEGITAKDRANIAFAPASVTAAVTCGICPTCETVAGKIKIRSTVRPTADLTAEYWIETGKE